MKLKGLFVVLGALAFAALIMYMSGVFSTDKIKPGPVQEERPSDFSPALTAQAETRSIVETYEAVGSLRPRTETQIEAQVTGKVVQIKVKPGDAVKRGDTLIVLEDKEFKTRLGRALQGLRSAQSSREEAKQGVNAAKAAFTKADLQFKRITKLYKDKAVSSRELEKAQAEFLQTQAQLEQAREGLNGAEAGVRQAQKLVEEARITRNYTVIRSPESAEVVRRLVEPGDLAVPGKPLLIVQTAGSLRLEAFVREGLIGRIRPGEELSVNIDALDKTVTGVIEEVEPSADPKTRTFLVKLGLPEVMGAYPGMFARLLVPGESRRAVLVPATAVQRAGQLETVLVKEDEQWRTHYVKIGKTHGDLIEVLTGLNGNETVALFGKGNV